MRLLALLSLLLTFSAARAMQGPGGFIDNNGETSLVLWLDASQLTGLVADQKIQTWTDMSGHGNNATQSTEANRPTYKESFLNSLAVVSFLESNDTDMSGSIANSMGKFEAPATIIALVKFDKPDQSEGGASNNNDYVMSIGSEGPIGSNSGGEMTAMARRKSADGFNDHYYTYDGTQTDISQTAVLGDNSGWFIIVQIQRSDNSTDPYHEAFVDGSAVAYSTNNYSGPMSTNGDYEIGDWTRSADFADDYYLKGDIAELMVFSEVLDNAELNIIQNYLEAKWNGTAASEIDISMGSTFDDDYEGNLASKGHYDSDVIGIGQESTTVKLETAEAKGIKINSVTNYGDGDYLFAGHKVSTNDLSTDGLTGNQQRWERVWYFDITDAGSAATTSITFDISDAGLGGEFDGSVLDYDIIFKSTEGGSWSFMSASAAYDGDQITFSGVDISGNGGANGDGYYTLVTLDKNTSPIGVASASLGDNGPGGIETTNNTSTLRLWLDPESITASDGDGIIGWEDQSGYDKGPTQSTTSNQPVYDTDNAVNGIGTILFDGTDDYLQGNLDSSPMAPFTIATVCYFGSENQGDGDFNNDYIISIGSTDNSETEHIGVARRKDELPGPGSTNENVYYSWRGQTPSYGPVIDGLEWKIITGTHGESGQRHNVYFEGEDQTAPSPDYTANFTGTASDFELGRWVGANNYLNGQIAEIILFSEELNAARLNILHSYLSAKYAIALTANDKYAGDESAINYDLNVAGVGTETTVEFSTVGSNVSATSAGLNVAIWSSETDDSGANDTFRDGDYFMIGHNTTENQSIDTDLDIDAASTDDALEGALDRRAKRDWYVDLTETEATATMTVDLTFDFSEMGLSVFPDGSASNYRLLNRTSSSNDWTVLAQGSSINGDQVVFSGVSTIQDGSYITIGTIDETNSPLPVKLITFNAEIWNGQVSLHWTTAGETNNSHFEIERSSNGFDYERISFVDGKGTTQDISEYKYHDVRPLNGYSYYRLKQVDVGGDFSYSEIVSVEMKLQRERISIFPNPASNYITVTLPEREFEGGRTVIRSKLGDILLSEDIQQSAHIQFDISHLISGLYLLEITKDNKKEARKILIQH